DCPYIELFAATEGELSFGGERRDAPQNSFVGGLELHEHKMPVHWNALKVIPVRQRQVGVEFHSSFPKTAKDANHLLSGEKLHAVLCLFVSSGCRIRILQPKHVKRRGFSPQRGAQTAEDHVLQ